MVSTPPETRFAVKYPQYPLPTCEPGLTHGTRACNYTSRDCVLQSRTEYEGAQKIPISCGRTCATDHISCTNYTKSCEATTSNWTSEYRGPNLMSSGHCDMITKKCTEQRRVKWLPQVRSQKIP